MKHLGTKRLILRRFSINDEKKMFYNWANDDDVTEYLSWPSHSDIDVSKYVLQQWIQNYEKDDFYQWAIVLKELNEPIGSIGAVGQNDKIKMVHIGYVIGKK